MKEPRTYVGAALDEQARQANKQGTTAYRIVSESGTHFATVYDAEQAATDRDFYAEKYGCIVTVQRVTLDHSPRW
jgi:hypothetical protein